MEASVKSGDCPTKIGRASKLCGILQGEFEYWPASPDMYMVPKVRILCFKVFILVAVVYT